jgi:hypothetical protein
VLSITRPAMASERLQTNAAGLLVRKLKTFRRDGLAGRPRPLPADGRALRQAQAAQRAAPDSLAWRAGPNRRARLPRSQALKVRATSGQMTFRPSPSFQAGWHLVDINLVMCNLLDVMKRQSAGHPARRCDRHARAAARPQPPDPGGRGEAAPSKPESYDRLHP